MELISVSLARLVAIVDVQALDPRGRATTPEVFEELRREYGFSKAPQSLAEMDLAKGIVFNAGRIGDVAINALTFFANGVIIDTRSSTDDCEKVLDHMLGIASEKYGAVVSPHRKHYVSHHYFRSEIRLSLLHPRMQAI